MKLSKTAFAMAALLGAVATAQATTVTFYDVVSTWSNAIGGQNVVYGGPNTAASFVDWGTGGTSGYDFFGVSTVSVDVVAPDVSDPFVLGTFQHRNQVINPGTSINSVRLEVNAKLRIGAEEQGVQTYRFLFEHDETPNDAVPCPYFPGSAINANGCADAVKTSTLSDSSSFIVDGTTYTVNVFGFFCEACQEFTNTFYSPEGGDNRAEMNFVVGVHQAPEPSMLALVGVGLLGAAAARRRKA